MTIRRLVLGVMLATGIVFTLLQAGFGASAHRVSSWGIDGKVGDSTAVHELSAAYFSSRPMSVQSTANVSGTVAILAGELLLDPAMRSVEIPLLRK